MAAFASVPAQRPSPGIWTWPQAGGSGWLGLSGDGGAGLEQIISRGAFQLAAYCACVASHGTASQLAVQGPGLWPQWLAPRLPEEGTPITLPSLLFLRRCAGFWRRHPEVWRCVLRRRLPPCPAAVQCFPREPLALCSGVMEQLSGRCSCGGVPGRGSPRHPPSSSAALAGAVAGPAEGRGPCGQGAVPQEDALPQAHLPLHAGWPLAAVPQESLHLPLPFPRGCCAGAVESIGSSAASDHRPGAAVLPANPEEAWHS